MNTTRNELLLGCVRGGYKLPCGRGESVINALYTCQRYFKIYGTNCWIDEKVVDKKNRGDPIKVKFSAKTSIKFSNEIDRPFCSMSM